jgi:glucose/arabinose dehydrogenase
MRKSLLIVVSVIVVVGAAAGAGWLATRPDGPPGTAAGPGGGAGPAASDETGGGGASAEDLSPAPAETAAPSDAPVTEPNGPVPTGGAEGAPADAARATPPSLDLRRVGGTFDEPVFLTARRGDPRRLYIVERNGVVRVIRNGKPLRRPFLDISSRVSTASERGLLSLVFDPRYSSNRFVYVYYTGLNGTIRIVRYRTFHAERVNPRSAKVLLSIAHPAGNHNGGQLAFGTDGLLYAGTGDGGGAGDTQGNAQNRSRRLGKLLTIDVRAARPTARVFAYGLRNPWRFSFDHATGDLWIGDVGQGSREEIDYLAAGAGRGANFGWNAYEGTLEFKPQAIDRSRLVWPVFEYGREQGYSVTGGYVYRGSALPGLRGWYLFADWGSGRVWRMNGPDGDAVRISLGRRVPSIVSFGENSAGELYVVSLAGAVYRIVAR